MPTTEIAFLVVLAVLVWFWVDTLRAREAGMAAARAACSAAGLQLLDDTVSTASLRIDRNEKGHAVLRRVYAFEFSDTGDNRRTGSVTLRGAQVVMVSIQPEVVEMV